MKHIRMIALVSSCSDAEVEAFETWQVRWNEASIFVKQVVEVENRVLPLFRAASQDIQDGNKQVG
jgi:hypothetical protein